MGFDWDYVQARIKHNMEGGMTHQQAIHELAGEIAWRINHEHD